MFVPMMDVGIVDMGVGQCLVLVGMAVRLSWRVVGQVFMLVVFVVAGTEEGSGGESVNHPDWEPSSCERVHWHHSFNIAASGSWSARR
jgi:hypothetical protein